MLRYSDIYSTHVVDEALFLGTRVLVMSKHLGQVIANILVDFTKSYEEENSDDVLYRTLPPEAKSYP